MSAAWYDGAMRSARVKSAEFDPTTRTLGSSALDELEKPATAEAIQRLGTERFHRVLAALERGDHDEALRRWCDPELTYQERRAAM